MYIPNPDRQMERPAGFCQICGGELYAWELVYIPDGEPVCEEGLEDYAKDYFAPTRWVLGNWIRRDKE